MSTNVAELFVELGVKKESEALKALQEVKKSLVSGKTAALGLAAATAGVFYGLDKLTSSTLNFGNNLRQMSLLTGMSSTTFQKWGIEAIKAGGSAQEMQSALVSVQSTIAKMKMSGQAPAGWQMIATTMGLGKMQWRQVAQHPEQLMKILTQYAKATKNVNTDMANQWLASMGLSSGVIATMRTNRFKLSDLGKPMRDVLSPREVRELSIAKGKVGLMKKDIEIQFAQFVMANLPLILSAMQDLTRAILLSVGVAIKAEHWVAHGAPAKLAEWFGGKLGQLSGDVDEDRWHKFFKDMGMNMNQNLGVPIGPMGGMVVHHHHNNHEQKVTQNIHHHGGEANSKHTINEMHKVAAQQQLKAHKQFYASSPVLKGSQ